MTTERDDIEQEGQIAPQVEGDALPPAAEEEQRPLSPREEALEAIYAKRREELQAETGLDPADVGEGDGIGTAGTEGEGGDPPTRPEPEPAPAGAVAPANENGASPQPGADEPTVDLVVNGQTIRVTQSEAIRRAQIASAGYNALQQLGNERRAREAAEAEVARLRAGQQAAPAQQPTADGADDDIDLKTIEALRYGTDEEMREALRVVRRVSRAPAEPAPPVDTGALVESVATKVRADLDFQQAMDRVGTEFATVFGDTDLATLAATRVQAIIADDASKGIHRAPYDVLREACQTVDAKFVRRPAETGARPTASATPPTNGAAVQIDGQGRDASKRRLVAGPAAPLARQAVPSADARPASETEIRRQGFDEIRRSRGQG